MTQPAHAHSPATLSTGHIGINVTDLERSTRFYQHVFGLDVTARSQERGREFAFLGRDGKLLITLWQQSKARFAPDRAGLHHLSFQVDSIDQVEATQKRLETLGATFVHRGIVPHAEGTTSGGIFFEDPDGTRLEIYSPTGAEGRAAPTQGAPSCGFF
jgi:catechol-2,3-dioxygenase